MVVVFIGNKFVGLICYQCFYYFVGIWVCFESKVFFYYQQYWVSIGFVCGGIILFKLGIVCYCDVFIGCVIGKGCCIGYIEIYVVYCYWCCWQVGFYWFQGIVERRLNGVFVVVEYFQFVVFCVKVRFFVFVVGQYQFICGMCSGVV